MKVLKKILTAVVQFLFFGLIAAMNIAGATVLTDMPDKKWFDRLPLWLVIIINGVLLVLIGLILYVAFSTP